MWMDGYDDLIHAWNLVNCCSITMLGVDDVALACSSSRQIDNCVQFEWLERCQISIFLEYTWDIRKDSWVWEYFIQIVWYSNRQWTADVCYLSRLITWKKVSILDNPVMVSSFCRTWILLYSWWFAMARKYLSNKPIVFMDTSAVGSYIFSIFVWSAKNLGLSNQQSHARWIWIAWSWEVVGGVTRMLLLGVYADKENFILLKGIK